MRTLRLFLAATILLIFLPATPEVAGAQLAPGNYQRSLEHDGYTRMYWFHVPVVYDHDQPTPLVVDYHGFGQTGLFQRQLSGYVELSDTAGFIAVHPDGVGNSWNGGDFNMGDAPILGVDDVGFTKAMIRAIAEEVNVDASRLYVTGLSAGASMTQRMGCDAADYIAAIAPIAKGFPYANVADCVPSFRMPIHLSLGLTDTVVSYANASLSIPIWRNLNSCISAVPDETINHGASSRCDYYRNCASTAEVVLCSVVGDAAFQGHVLYTNDDNIDLAMEGWTHLSSFQHESPPVLVADAPAVVGSLASLATLFTVILCRRGPTSRH